MPRISIAVLAAVLALALTLPQPALGADPLGRPGPGDLVVFIAKEMPTLYRLVGRRAAPFGNLRLEQPKAVIADQTNRCFYVLDNPKYNTGMGRILRVTPDGRSSVVFQARWDNGPFDLISSLCLGPGGKLYLAGKSSGLYEISQGRARRISLGQDRGVQEVTAAVALPRGQMLVATTYDDDGHAGRRAQPPGPRQTGGHIFFFNLNTPGAPPRLAVANRLPGGKFHDTHWRSIRQMFMDAAGRLVLVDYGSKTAAENTYTGYRYNYRQAKNPLGAQPLKHAASTITGGVILLFRNGRLEDLTYKNPGRTAGPLRHPMGIAQWDRQTYLVADPEMYVKGLGQVGGLMLLGRDGSRDPRWSFGRGIRPTGVAILRGVGAPAQAGAEQPEPAALSLGHLTAIRRGGAITHISSLKVSRLSQDNSRTLTGFISGWSQVPQQQAAARLRQVCQGAAWQVRADGTAAWVATGLAGPYTLTGTGRVNGNLGLIVLSYKTKNMFDTQSASLNARLTRGQAGGITAEIELNIMTKRERIQAVFTQALLN